MRVVSDDVDEFLKFSFSLHRPDKCGTTNMPRQRLDLMVEFPGLDASRETRVEAPQPTMKVLEGWRWIEILQIRRESIFEECHDLVSVFRVINTRMLRPRKWKTRITVAWCIGCLRIMSAVKSPHGENGLLLGVDVFRNQSLMLC